jgi:hypothetical protein
MAEEITLRHELWDECRPWTDGLTRLWDTTQEELLQQSGALPDDSRRWEAKYINLTPLEEIAHKHLRVARQGVEPRSPISPQSWLALAQELDERGISLDEELSGLAGQVLGRVRKKGQPIETWQAALHLQMQTTLEDGKRYSLKHLVMKVIHNAAKTASYHVEKAWPREGS